jgi:hypothetical protein
LTTDSTDTTDFLLELHQALFIRAISGPSRNHDAA